MNKLNKTSSQSEKIGLSDRSRENHEKKLLSESHVPYKKIEVPDSRSRERHSFPPSFIITA